MEVFPLILFICVFLLAYIAWCEYSKPGYMNEGFANMTGAIPYWANFVSPRSDIGLDQEDSNYVRDPRYFNDYVDVSRLGVEYDFCRVLAPAGEPANQFFACALAGTEGLGSTSFRTKGVADGFQLSYDDYMRDVNGDGRADYCRILKQEDGSWQPMCALSTDTAFDPKEVVDGAPPADIQTLLEFYQGCVMWLRFKGNMLDVVNNAQIASMNMTIDETPRRAVSEGLSFNGDNQFLRVYDSGDLTLGANVPLRSVRAVMMWVRFEEFTNNAKIFDFGNGKGNGNFFLGILGKGDPVAVGGGPAADDTTATLPAAPSGAQPVDEMSPQRLMETTSANVNEWRCDGFEQVAKEPTRPIGSFPATASGATGGPQATLIYEVWDQEQRKMRMKVNSIVPVKKWVHICVTASDGDAFRPNIGIYVNGELVLKRPSGFLPSTGSMTNCYIGKSNWANGVSKYEDRDELFRGQMFDFRMYNTKVSEEFIKRSVAWGKDVLNISA